MRLLPASLFGRLILILIGGLLLAQLVSTGLLLKDRGDIIRENTGLQLVQRIAAIVYLLEDTAREERPKIVRAFNTPLFRTSLSDRPPEPDPDAQPARHLEMLLLQSLDKRTLLQVHTTPLPEGFRSMRRNLQRHSPDSNRERARGPESRRFRRPPPGALQANIQLGDGQWLTIRRPLPETFADWPMKILAYLGILLVSIILLSLLAVRWVTRPLNTLAGAAENLGKDISHPALPESGPREVKRAARAFNTMQTRLRRYIEDRSQVLAAVSHDLKTPITRLRLRSALLQDEPLQQRFNRDLDEMEQMVQATLDYLRGSESKEQPVPININALLGSLQDDAAELGWEMTLSGSRVAPYRGRPLALKRCLMNLIENAVRYGKAADVRIEESDQYLTVIVADRGLGVAEDDLESLFNPFYRGEASRARETGGTGLGLGIARNIARAHGGDVKLRRGPNGGLEAVVALPR
ncbi:MAG: ATP-binding protein [Sedimenticola sp.]|nr:ATP-binding protein [Sedimenticola sp.]